MFFLCLIGSHFRCLSIPYLKSVVPEPPSFLSKNVWSLKEPIDHSKSRHHAPRETPIATCPTSRHCSAHWRRQQRRRQTIAPMSCGSTRLPLAKSCQLLSRSCTTKATRPSSRGPASRICLVAGHKTQLQGCNWFAS